jgi:hypothetical protein
VRRRREAVTRELAREGRIDKRKGAIVVIDGERLARDGERARKG